VETTLKGICLYVVVHVTLERVGRHGVHVVRDGAPAHHIYAAICVCQQGYAGPRWRPFVTELLVLASQPRSDGTTEQWRGDGAAEVR
jgi:hypothetical protein